MVTSTKIHISNSVDISISMQPPMVSSIKMLKRLKLMPFVLATLVMTSFMKSATLLIFSPTERKMNISIKVSLLGTALKTTHGTFSEFNPFFLEFENLAAAEEFLGKTMKEENGTMSDAVETLWNSGDELDSTSPSEAALYTAVLPGGFIVPAGNAQYQALIDLRGDYHSLRVIEGAKMTIDGTSVERKFDLRPAVLLSDEKEVGETWEAIYKNETSSDFAIYKELL